MTTLPTKSDYYSVLEFFDRLKIWVQRGVSGNSNFCCEDFEAVFGKDERSCFCQQRRPAAYKRMLIIEKYFSVSLFPTYQIEQNNIYIKKLRDKGEVGPKDIKDGLRTYFKPNLKHSDKAPVVLFLDKYDLLVVF